MVVSETESDVEWSMYSFDAEVEFAVYIYIKTKIHRRNEKADKTSRKICSTKFWQVENKLVILMKNKFLSFS